MELIRQELRQLEGAWRRFLAGGGFRTPGDRQGAIFLMVPTHQKHPENWKKLFESYKKMGKKIANSSDTGALRPDKGDETFGMGLGSDFWAFFDETIKVLTHDGPKAEWFVWWFHIGESSQNDISIHLFNKLNISSRQVRDMIPVEYYEFNWVEATKQF